MYIFIVLNYLCLFFNQLDACNIFLTDVDENTYCEEIIEPLATPFYGKYTCIEDIYFLNKGILWAYGYDEAAMKYKSWKISDNSSEYEDILLKNKCIKLKLESFIKKIAFCNVQALLEGEEELLKSRLDIHELVGKELDEITEKIESLINEFPLAFQDEKEKTFYYGKDNVYYQISIYKGVVWLERCFEFTFSRLARPKHYILNILSLLRASLQKRYSAKRGQSKIMTTIKRERSVSRSRGLK